MIKQVGDYFVSAPSRRKNKKYDVYDKNYHYKFSYGDIRYQHYKDAFKYYSSLNHLDEQRRKNYRTRHKNDYINNPDYPGFWSYHFLW